MRQRQQRVAGRRLLRRETAPVGLDEAAVTEAAATATEAAAKAVAAKVVVGTEAEVTEAGRGEVAPQP